MRAVHCSKYLSIGLPIEYMKSGNGEKESRQQKLHGLGLLCGVGVLF